MNTASSLQLQTTHQFNRAATAKAIDSPSA
jgi:hypothetical protein